MTEGNTAYDLDIESLLDRVNALLDEWGACERHEPGIGNIYYPSTSPGADLIDTAGRTLRDDRAYTRVRRMIEVATGPDGKTRKVPVRHMVPAQAEKQTRVRKIVSAPDWPPHIQAMERILGRLPNDLLRAVCLYYIYTLTLRECALIARVSKSRIERDLDRARYMVAGQIVTEPDLT